MADFKTSRGNRCFQFVFGLPPNMRMQLALCDRLEECTHLLFLSSRLKFYTPVWKIAYPAGHIEAFDNTPHSPTKPYALDIAFVKYLKRYHDLIRDSGSYCQITDRRAQQFNLPSTVR